MAGPGVHGLGAHLPARWRKCAEALTRSDVHLPSIRATQDGPWASWRAGNSEAHAFAWCRPTRDRPIILSCIANTGSARRRSWPGCGAPTESRLGFTPARHGPFRHVGSFGF